MAGQNPYITKARVSLPTRPFRVTFRIEETGETKEATIDPAAIPYGRTGEPGSVMDLAEAAGVEIDHACGGVCACATCHVYVTKGLETCPPATDNEEDMLDTARAVTPESRLSCQCVPDGTADVEVVVPGWNKNLVKEGH
jgi:ferredoxin, 2Fe-2S